MKFTIEIDVPEVTDEWIDGYLEHFPEHNNYVQGGTVSRFDAVKYLVDNPYNIITEITNQINTILQRKVELKTGKKVALVEEGLLEKAKEEAIVMLDQLQKKNRKTNKDRLMIEYLKTFIGNPIPVNYICFTCGRVDEMKRKGE